MTYRIHDNETINKDLMMSFYTGLFVGLVIGSGAAIWIAVEMLS